MGASICAPTGSPIADAIFHYIMHDFSLALREYLAVHGHLQQFSECLGMDVDMVIWSDDLAVPIITEQAVDLVPALLRLIDFVRKEFALRGFQLNLAKGKTGLVATFCGTNAAAMRRKYQLVPQPGTMFEFHGGKIQFVHMTPAYRHLGTLFTSDQTLVHLTQRSLIVLALPDLHVNNYDDRSWRIDIFLFACGLQLFWHLGPLQALFCYRFMAHPDRQTARQNALCRCTRWWRPFTAIPWHCLSQAGIVEPRVRLATERLLYAQGLYHHGPAFLQMMTHAEAAQQPCSWLLGLQHDLRWLHGVEAVAGPCLLDKDMPTLIDIWQQDKGRWKARVRRASVRHLYQEAMILEVQKGHADIFQLLRDQAFTFDPDPALLHLKEGQYQCPDCDRCFTTPQGGHTHRRKKHDIYSLEHHHLLDSATAQPAWPTCGTPSACSNTFPTCLGMARPILASPTCSRLAMLCRYAAEQILHTMKGQACLDALPAAGPFGNGPTAHERNLARLQATKQALEAEIQDFVQPDDPVGAGARLGEILSAVTQQWFFDFCAASHRTQDVERPQDRWVDILCKLPVGFESWAARTFILWGRHILPDFIAELFDVEAEACLDAEYAELAAEFDEYWTEIRLNRVDGQTAAAVQVQPQPLPHRPVRPPQKDAKPRSVPHFEVPCLFADQERWQTELEQVRWQDMPPDPLTPFVPGLAPRPSFLVVHLFAGRRRDHDLHSWLEAWAQRTNIALTIILSLDTAISPVLGNLDSSSTTWACLQELYLQGFVAGFSSACWTEPNLTWSGRDPFARWCSSVVWIIAR